MDYKFTLNLPLTNFNMKADLPKKEKVILNFWKKKTKKKNKKQFILNDGPPYANGDIHIGHAFNKILKDIIIKFKILTGHDVCFIAGWDCHGLPIELNIEKRIKNNTINKKKFRDLCKKYALEQIYIQKKSFLRLGISTNWEKIYTTMNEDFEFAITDSFNRIFQKNLIYRGCKPIYWCFDCSSALAEAEIEYELIESDSIYILFEINEKKLFIKYNLEKIGFVIWTTTPWTIPFNEAVAIKNNTCYVLIKYKNYGYLIIENMLLEFIKKIKNENIEILLFLNSIILDKITLKHPIYNKKINIIYSDHVKLDSGTGCVHIAPSHGYDDYKLAILNKLPVLNYINKKGYFYHSVKYFSLLNIYEVNKKIIKFLKFKNNLILQEKINHKYPHCWRHKSQLIFRTTKQWFFNITENEFKNKINNSLNLINWVPKSSKEKMISMFENRLDWCISRQRSWGVPLILLTDKNNKTHEKNSLIIKKSLLIIKKFGVEFWYKFNIYRIFQINKNLYKKNIDVLDVWFDSSASYKHILIKKKTKLALDLCVEGNDQHRGWFQVSILNSLSNYNHIPYKTIISHGFILDKYGRKMSKSLKNVISPNEVIENYGADILRLWTSSVNYYFDVNMSKEILNRISETYRKIRNTFRFFLSNLYDFEYHKNENKINLDKIDKFILYKFNNLKNEIIESYLNYKFHNVYKKIYIFFIDDLGSKYLDIIKDRLYTENPDSISRRTAQYVIYHLLYNLSKLIAPILCFTAEEIWSFIEKKETQSIFSSNFNTCLKKIKKIEFGIKESIFWRKIFNLKSFINKIIEEKRTNNFLRKSLEIKIFFFCNIYWFNLLSKVKNELNIIFSVSEIKMILIKQNKKNNSKFFGINIEIEKSIYDKCERCWYRNDKYIIKNKKNIKICKKCIINLYYK